MIFGEVNIADAVGAIVAHVTKGPGFAYRKGQQLSAHDVDVLRAAGIHRITVAILEGGDVGEDEAASALGQGIGGQQTAAQVPFTGRCNLVAASQGLVVVDAARISSINAIDDGITVATVRSHTRAEAGQMIATVKIIPFAVRSDYVKACLALAADPEPPIRLLPFQRRVVGLVQTRLPHQKESVLQSTVEVTAERLEALGSRLRRACIVDHRHASVASALAGFRAKDCDLLLAIGASATSDRRDVIPMAIEAAGGVVEQFGMPVDPGNLMLIGRIGETPVLVLPGCARSPKISGFDWVLHRVLAGLPVTRRDVAEMGVGGLLSEDPDARAAPTPAARVRTEGGRAPVAAIVLAAGQSTRMAPDNKLLEPLAGKPLVLHAIEAALASRASPVIVVVGHEAERLRHVIGELPVTIVENKAYESGLSASIRSGLRAVPVLADGAVILLGDMPRIRAEHIDRLIAAFLPNAGRAICVATYRDMRGHPVLWHRSLFDELSSLSRDRGGRELFDRHADRLHSVAMDDDGVLVDVDHRDALLDVARSLNA